MQVQLFTSLANVWYPLHSWVGWSNEGEVPCVAQGNNNKQPAIWESNQDPMDHRLISKPLRYCYLIILKTRQTHKALKYSSVQLTKLILRWMACQRTLIFSRKFPSLISFGWSLSNLIHYFILHRYYSTDPWYALPPLIFLYYHAMKITYRIFSCP